MKPATMSDVWHRSKLPDQRGVTSLGHFFLEFLDEILFRMER